MAKLGLRHTSEVQTRDKYTKVNMELGMTIDGKEIPNAAILGSALEDAVKLIQERITESYQVVPARQDAPPVGAVVTPTALPVADPVAAAQASASHTGLGFPPSR
jgi:hypothetical protein